jgi:hypothetical protein
MTVRFHYPVKALAPDYARSGAGFALCGGLLAFASPAPVAGGFLAAATGLFLVYLVRTVCRQLTQIELDEAGIRALGPLGADIRWENLRSMQLGYYSTRAGREEGWMQLRLRGAGGTLRIESELDGFPDLVRLVAAQASRRDLALDVASLANLRALGA